MQIRNQTYIINETPLGSGTYGKVFSAFSKSSGEKVAIKTYNIYVGSDFVRECYALTRLNGHPNIVSIKDVDVIERKKLCSTCKKANLTFPKADCNVCSALIECKKQCVVVLELADKTLMDIIKDKNYPIFVDKKDISATTNMTDIRALKKIWYQLIRGLAYMHQSDIMHRDIKPNNILISGTSLYTCTRVFYADLGLARADNNYVAHATSKEDFKKTGTIYTLWYRAPELLLGGNAIDEKADIWALACTLAETLLGKAIFPGDSEVDQLFRIFRTFGTPISSPPPTDNIDESLKYWEGVDKFPEWKVTYPSWKTQPLKSVIFKGCYGEFVDVLSKMFHLNPKLRPSASELLVHPFFAELINEFSVSQPIKVFDNTTPYEVLNSPKKELECKLSSPKSHLNKNIRKILMDWVLDVVKEYHLSINTFYTAVGIIDSYVTATDVKRDSYQGYAIAAVVIASRLHDVVQLNMEDMTYICDYAYPEGVIKKYQSDIIKTIGFNFRSINVDNEIKEALTPERIVCTLLKENTFKIRKTIATRLCKDDIYTQSLKTIISSAVDTIVPIDTRIISIQQATPVVEKSITVVNDDTYISTDLQYYLQPSTTYMEVKKTLKDLGLKTTGSREQLQTRLRHHIKK